MRKQSIVNEFSHMLATATEKEYSSFGVVEVTISNRGEGGTFRGSFEPTAAYTREQWEKELSKRIRAVNRQTQPTGVDPRSKQMQLAMAFIGEHRELIPFLEYVSKRADKNKAAKEYVHNLRNIPAVVLEYTQRSPRLSWWKKNNDDFPPLSCLLDELPRIPMAWRA